MKANSRRTEECFDHDTKHWIAFRYDTLPLRWYYSYQRDWYVSVCQLDSWKPKCSFNYFPPTGFEPSLFPRRFLMKTAFKYGFPVSRSWLGLRAHYEAGFYWLGSRERNWLMRIFFTVIAPSYSSLLPHFPSHGPLVMTSHAAKYSIVFSIRKGNGQ